MGAFSVDVEGATLSGEARGDNPALVFLHGFSGSGHDWDRLWAALPADLPLLRYDLRGFGDSEAQEDILFSHADDLARLLDACGISRISVAGVSAGGAAALNFALNHPGRVDRLILVSPLIVGWGWSDEWKTLWRAMTTAARAGDMRLARKLWWEHPLFDPVRNSDAAEELRRSIDAFHGKQWIKDYQRDELPDVERLHELAAPTLLLTGEHDLPDFRLIGDVLDAAVPDIKRIDFAGSGHMVHLERPRDAAQAIAEFMGWSA